MLVFHVINRETHQQLHVKTEGGVLNHYPTLTYPWLKSDLRFGLNKQFSVWYMRCSQTNYSPPGLRMSTHLFYCSTRSTCRYLKRLWTQLCLQSLAKMSIRYVVLNQIHQMEWRRVNGYLESIAGFWFQFM